MASRPIERIKTWWIRGNVSYPIHVFNILGLIACLMAMFLIVGAGFDIYTAILLLFFGLGGLNVWLYRFKKGGDSSDEEKRKEKG